MVKTGYVTLSSEKVTSFKGEEVLSHKMETKRKIQMVKETL